MRFLLVPADGYLRAELTERESVAETREFLQALAAACIEAGATRALIAVNTSRPIFKVEQYGASLYLRALAARPECRVALVSNHPEIRASHEYLEVLAGLQGAAIRSFSHEPLAIAWLRSEAQPRPAQGKAAAKSP